MLNLPTLEEIDRELQRRSFAEFVKAAWPHVEFGTNLIWSWHLDAICSHLQAVHENKIRQLIINLPFRMGKSTLISVLFPAWIWIHKPCNKIITTSYDEALSLRDSLKMRNLIESDFYKALNPALQISNDQSQKRYFTNNEGGHRLSRGINSGSTGHTANLLIADDPMSAVMASSDAERHRALESWNNQFMTRLTPPGEGKVIIVMQRLHNQDLCGVYEKDSSWDHLVLPMVWEGEHRTRSSIGWRDPRSELGELLFPGYFTQEVVDGYRQSHGPQFFSSQLQQRPVAAEGSIIKREWIQYYKELPQARRYSISLDTAFKTGAQNDYSVMQLWAECDNGHYLVDMVRAKLEYTALKNTVIDFYNKRPASEVIVEDKASGQSLLQDLRRFTKLPVIAVIPGRDMPGDKGERLQCVAGLFEAGKVFIPEGKPWTFDFVSELTEFGFQPHDDTVDACTQYLIRHLSSRNKVRITIV